MLLDPRKGLRTDPCTGKEALPDLSKSISVAPGRDSWSESIWEWGVGRVRLLAVGSGGDRKWATHCADGLGAGEAWAGVAVPLTEAGRAGCWAGSLWVPWSF